MNTANKLTMLRVLLIPIFITLLYVEFEIYTYITNIKAALFVFIIAALTDLADGIVARRRDQITDFGTFMDPLADKILTFAAMLWFIEVGLMPAWLVLIVIIREFMVTGIRLVAAAKSKVIAASTAGKLKTLVTINCIVAMFLIYIFLQEMPWALIICWALIGATTVVSGVEYFVKNREIMKLDR
ncbi:MAG: CDP-diacylglycerol--glycerol-3-phosphate 3-phosphatidyltransferase [Oscillospiraceae bacterium]|nr:CDP-diacylglycerol--glycerol-3-phosphate 3-phosphatidyltransferase [Oscillospiraceae bacterium]